ncbi:hypothetical protein BpHYR1_037192 [Brachionus plicatilis]|uniref:Uncharacterized protein n=1 Tax=Brachionus plicatilis TaxID=10195 RepID=A0A3M7SHR5_BRAPC|nr:hypothetical protein BpHYR1_037192 [Brachionus plicatilis]
MNSYDYFKEIKDLIKKFEIEKDKIAEKILFEQDIKIKRIYESRINEIIKANIKLTLIYVDLKHQFILSKKIQSDSLECNQNSLIRCLEYIVNRLKIWLNK